MKDLMGRATTVGKWLTTSPKNVAVIADLWPHLLLLTELQLLRHKSWLDCVNAIVCSVWIIGNGKSFTNTNVGSEWHHNSTPSSNKWQQCFCSRLEIKVEVKRWQEQWINCCQDSHSSSPCFSPFCRLPWSKPTALQVAGGQTWDLWKSLNDQIFWPKILLLQISTLPVGLPRSVKINFDSSSVNVLTY